MHAKFTMGQLHPSPRPTVAPAAACRPPPTAAGARRAGRTWRPPRIRRRKRSGPGGGGSESRGLRMDLKLVIMLDLMMVYIG